MDCRKNFMKLLTVFLFLYLTTNTLLANKYDCIIASKKYESIYIMGGGSKNFFIHKELSKITQKNVKSINIKGLKDLYIESQAFAYLAARSITNLPISYPKTTGVKKPASGGKNF